jgi:hypothetical protein
LAWAAGWAPRYPVPENGDGSAVGTVTYALTALTPAGRDHLSRFATSYQPYPHSWQEAIEQLTG